MRRASCLFERITTAPVRQNWIAVTPAAQCYRPEGAWEQKNLSRPAASKIQPAQDPDAATRKCSRGRAGVVATSLRVLLARLHISPGLPAKGSERTIRRAASGES